MQPRSNLPNSHSTPNSNSDDWNRSFPLTPPNSPPPPYQTPQWAQWTPLEQGSNRSDGTLTPTSFSTFSMTSSMEHRAFREDGGRRFQASNDEYGLPADEVEFARLDRQHFGHKAMQHDKNYLAPVDKALAPSTDGERKRALDIGAGTGVWTIEMANEFPHVDWIGTDLIPVQRDTAIPENVQFVVEDATRGLGFPDGYFDVVHARTLIAGVRNWKFLIDEAIRVLRPGGLLVFVETCLPWGVKGVSPEESRIIAPGQAKWNDYQMIAFENRGYDNSCGDKTISKAMRDNGSLVEMQQLENYLPMWGWSNEPHVLKAGVITRDNCAEMPDAMRLIIIDAGEVSEQRFEELKAGWLKDLGREGCNTCIPVWHNWGWKKLE